MKLRKRTIAVVFLIVFAFALTLLFIRDLKFDVSWMESAQKPKFDVRKEIELLNRNHPSSWGDFYKIKELNWNVWRKQWVALGGTLIKMDTWDEFKESLRQNEGYVLFYELGLDETNRVIWYTIRSSPNVSFAVYFQY